MPLGFSEMSPNKEWAGKKALNCLTAYSSQQFLHCVPFLYPGFLKISADIFLTKGAQPKRYSSCSSILVQNNDVAPFHEIRQGVLSRGDRHLAPHDKRS